MLRFTDLVADASFKKNSTSSKVSHVLHARLEFIDPLLVVELRIVCGINFYKMLKC